MIENRGLSTQRASSDGPSFGLPRREGLFTTLCIILKSQSHYPLNTKSAIIVRIIVEVVVGQTKSINLNFSSQRALVHLLNAQCSALALAIFLAWFHLKLKSKQIGKKICTAAGFWWTLICYASVFSTRIKRRKRCNMKVHALVMTHDFVAE